MAKTTFHAGIIAKVEPARSSVNGNPAWWVHFTDGRSPVRTQTDASVGYSIDNFKPGTMIRYGVTRNGRMISAEEFDTSK